jgi:drug/metabolite transporter (DMT)-like permease
MSRSVKAHVLLILTTLVWGATFVIIKDALRDISPLVFNAVRMTLAALTLAVAFRYEFGRFTLGAIGSGILIGLFLAAGNEMQTYGLQFTMPSKSAFLTGLAVVLVPVFLAIFWRQRISRWSAVGVLLAFVGLYLLTIPATANARANFSGIERGDLFTIGCAIVFAFHIIFMGHATQAHRWQQITLVQTVTAAVVMSACAPVLESPQIHWTPRVITAILFTGTLSLAAAFSVQAWAQQFTPATHTALIFSLEPGFAWITSALFLGERLGTRAAIGAALILAGVVISEEKGSRESTAVPPDHAAVPQVAESQAEKEVSRFARGSG